MTTAAQTTPEDENIFGGPKADWGLLALLVVDFLGVCMCMCPCGFIAPYALVLTGGCAIAAWWIWIKAPHRNIFWRLVRMACVIAITMLLLQNLGHVMWFGHHPLFRTPSFFGG